MKLIKSIILKFIVTYKNFYYFPKFNYTSLKNELLIIFLNIYIKDNFILKFKKKLITNFKYSFKGFDQ